jgi:hypothetical protein
MLSQYDQSVYDQGYKYIPQSKYLLNPFQVPQGDENEVPTGIATTYQAQAGGGGGGMGYTGGITGLTTDFQKAVDARTQRLEDAYNNPSTAKLFGMNMFKQDVNPQDAGFYVGEGMRIPQQRTMAGKMFQPQSPQEIMEEGYTPRTNIGILNAILGKADKFGTLSRPDQAFITSQMGYTGPTVFGDNQSGLSKDPFGLNTRSAFGNYAERVGTEATDLRESLSGRLTDKYQDQFGITDDEELSFDPITGQYIGTNAAAVAKANAMTRLMRTKQQFYLQKTKERNELREQEKKRQEEAFQAQLNQQQREQRQADLNRIDRAYREETGGEGGSYATGESGVQSDGSYNDPFDPGGGEKDGGFIDGTNRRIDFMMGGLTDLVDIYD